MARRSVVVFLRVSALLVAINASLFFLLYPRRGISTNSIPEGCICIYDGLEYDFCYRLRENTSIQGRRMSCTSAAILHKLGLIGGNKNYVDLRNEEMPSPVMVTAFSQDHWDEARRLISTIRRFWPEQLIIAYDLGVDEATARIVREQSNIQYREFKFHDYPSYMQRLLDFRWKPIVIAETLNEFGAIWYMDSSIVMRKGDLQHVYDLLRCKRSRNRTINQLLASTALRDKREAITANESDWDQMQWLENIRECRKSTYLLHGYAGHGIFAVTHSNTYIYIPTNFNEIKKPKAKMYEAGIAFAVRTAETMENIVKWYVLCALEEGCMGGNYSHSCHFSESGDRFSKYADCHRFDQSVVNLLLANTYYYDPHYYVSEIVDFFQVVRGVSMIEEALNLTRGQTFEVLSNGLPVVGCARPSCFGWKPDGTPVSKNAIFYKTDGYADGYMRESVIPFDGDSHSFVPEVAQCEDSFDSRSCDVENEWVGGIAAATFDASHSTMMALRCCTYGRLGLSSDRGTATLTNKQVTIGGEVFYKDRQYGFDYIADVKKHRATNGSIFYDVQMRRMNCLPPPREQTLNVDTEVKEYVRELLSAAIALQKKKAKYARTFAFQAPLVSGGSDNKPSIQTITKVTDTQDARSEISSHKNVFDDSQAIPGSNNEQPFMGAFGAQSDGGFVDQGLASRVGPPPRIVGVHQGQPVYESSGVGFGGFFCFSGDTIVERSDGRMVRMDKLKLSDWILSVKDGKVVYTTLVKWIHRVPQQIALFVKLFLEDGSVLKLTTRHYIYRTQCTDMNNSARIENIGDEAVYAEKVNEGDCLYKLSQDEKTFYKSRVVKISNVMERGIYAPMTSTGDIVVNGVLASCHNVVRSHILQDTFFGIVPIINEFTKWIFGASEYADSLVELPLGMDVVAWLINSALPHNT